MSWITKQPRLTQIFCVVCAQLNDIGIYPNRAEVKQWIRQEIADNGITADEKEITVVLTGLLKEKAISEQDITRLRSQVPGTS